MKGEADSAAGFETGVGGKRELEAVEMSLVVKTKARVMGRGPCERAEDVRA